MSEIKTGLRDSLAPIDLTPQTGQELSETLAKFGFSVWGHGTPTDEAQNFFGRGVDARGYTDLMQVAIPLSVPEGQDTTKTIADSDMMNNWPHKRGTEVPNVVLLAIPDAEPSEKVYATTVLQGVIDEKIGAVDPELVLGFYEPATSRLTFNPVFDVTSNSHQQWIDKIKTRTANPGLSASLASATPIDPPDPITVPQSPTNHENFVW